MKCLSKADQLGYFQIIQGSPTQLNRSRGLEASIAGEAHEAF